MNPSKPPTSPRKSRYIALAISVGLFVVSLCLPVFFRDDGVRTGAGGLALLVGWMTFHPAWLANPCWIAGVVLLLLKRRLAAVIFAALAVVLALSSFTLLGAKLWNGDQAVSALSFGFYVWLAALLTLAGDSLYAITRPGPPQA